ncbi:helix-turn-helix transcriptional regulator [Streptomyces sp. B1866]|uniref:helix-turn-helix domain-containing protein n=1 Tax=Streptomyces sp. B1866 TaxID=3075431 RepID=UPI00288E97E8|nr:helix-turn-helix transcriptional regulator [Streptomyces sp. B1866]MDT3398486.1 helix-turn-helix transcriptional regulator [Streptomyces sp. B1866]
MAIAQMIRDLRESLGLSQGDLALRLQQATGTRITREYISRWERHVGGVIPSESWLKPLAQVLEVPFAALTYEATLSRMNRRTFVNLAALASTHGPAANELVTSIAGNDPGPITAIQTTHATDLLIASLTDKTARKRLKQWMGDGSTPLLRVNAMGILAKVPGQDFSVDVCRSLSHDADARRLYMTAVIARISGLPWHTAERIAADPCSLPSKATFLASRCANEVTNPGDAGARWCSATMLRDISHLVGGEPHARDRDQEW